ncbi:hypothetical protein [Sphingomonas sp. DT-204]|uniref:hypothetical protein n=1 Tax=Sphingomonas sp. DT-204 TaxID=3396166 RepID=UPI003F1B5BB2
MPQSMVTLPPDIVRHMIANCPGRTDEALQPRFGISYNTWRQIERGAALRRSLAERLVQRISAEREGSESDRTRS